MDSDNTFDDYKVKHLFLLIGENPLPNYVAAMKLLETGGTAYLVYTNQTTPQKNRLNITLKDQGFKRQEVALDKQGSDSNKSNAHRIYTKIKEDAQKVPSNERIGLHYTGGTNPMAIHAYRAIQDISELQKRTNTVYSYLDAKTLEIYIDSPKPDPYHRGVKLEVSLEILFQLHNYKWEEHKKPLPSPMLPDAAAEFVRLYQNEEIAKTWRTWSNTHFNKNNRNKNNGKLKEAIDSETEQWKSEDELSKLSLSLTGVHPEIIEVLRHKLDASQSQLSLRVTQTKGFSNCQQVCEWLGGIWLEHYVLSQIQEIAKDEKFKNLHIGESQMSFHIKKKDEKRGKFELDVAFMRSYQLFAISCTTSEDHKLCKLKLFEAYTRAKQLGGDEARVALVCCCDGNKSINGQSMYRYLKSQLEGAVNNPKIAVFVRQDLPDLKEKIADWVERNRGAL
jgi:hypothetical protein